MVKFVQVTAKTVPWSQRFFLKFFFGIERASREVARRERSSLSPLRGSSLFPGEKFHEKPLGPGYKDGYGRLKILF